MTPEELNRTIEFIIQSQARLAAAQEQDRQDRPEFRRWSKSITERVERLLEAQSRISESQGRASELRSRRLDQQDDFYRKSLEKTESFHTHVLHLLHMILNRLPPLRPSE